MTTSFTWLDVAIPFWTILAAGMAVALAVETAKLLRRWRKGPSSTP